MIYQWKRIGYLILCGIGAQLFFSPVSFGGVFSLTHYVTENRSALGLEPEFHFTSGTGLGVNLKYTYGIAEGSNLMGIVGTGGGDRNFRIGAAYILDVFPDIEGQPGIGIGFQSLYYRFAGTGQLEATLIPYLHKGLDIKKSRIEPFLAVPFGLAFNSGRHEGLFSFVLGSHIKQTENVHFIVELGIAINHTSSYFSGGISYYF